MLDDVVGSAPGEPWGGSHLVKAGLESPAHGSLVRCSLFDIMSSWDKKKAGP